VARRIRNPWWVLLVVILFGGVLGSVIAEAVVGFSPLGFLAREVRIGLDPPIHLNLRIIGITLGAVIRLNAAMVLGVILAIWIYRLL
jgi:hypothetical protein